MTFDTRHDGTRYPNTKSDDKILREETDPNCETEHVFAYNRTLADLIIDVLAGGPLVESADSDPENWVTLENAIIQNAALDLKALNIAVEHGEHAGDVCDEITWGEIKHSMRALARRMTAGAELAQRLRRARWGHPNFGGGENWEAKQKAKAASSDEQPKTATNDSGAVTP